jgi:hypothetical protein
MGDTTRTSIRVWDKNKKRPTRISRYLGTVRRTRIQTPFEASLRGLYEYGHVRFVWDVLDKNGILSPLRKIFPDDWKVLLAFALNRLIDPRPIKSIQSWHEKTYLIKKLGISASPKTISRVLERAGLSWRSRRDFFEIIRRNG